MTIHLKARSKVIAGILPLYLALPLPIAHAQVYEVATDGQMMVREGGGAVQWRPANAIATPSPPPPARSSVAPLPMNQMLTQAASRHGLHPQLLEALVWQESRWHQDASSPKGAKGLTQLMPSTARALGIDASDPAANLEGGAHYLRLMLDRFNGSLPLALAAYNAGPKRVEKAHGVPAITETRNYVTSILNRFNGQDLRTCLNLANCAHGLP